MILASFDFGWFLTAPGLLITGGILLLIIALIIFIVTGNKKGKTSKDVKDVQDKSVQESIIENTPAVDTNVTPADVMPTSSTPVSPVVNQTPAVTQEVNSVATSEPVTVVAQPMESSVQNQPTMNTMNESQVSSDFGVPNINSNINNNPVSMPEPMNSIPSSVVAPSQPVTNESVIGQSEIPTIIETATPRVEETVKQDMPNVMHENTTSASIPTITSSTTVPEEAPKVNERLIYGGASPVVPNIEVAHVEHRPIYGGANPLDNTQSIPVAHQASSTPMNNSINSTEPSIPTIEPASISSVQNVSVPKVEPSTQAQEPPKVDIPQVTPVAPATNNSTVETKQEPKIESLF